MIPTFRVLTEEDLPAFGPLTFPSYRLLLKGDQADEHPPVLAVGAFDGRLPIGLALIEETAESKTAEILSLAIAPLYRAKGVGRLLMEAVERELLERGARSVQVLYERRASSKAMDALLARQGFTDDAVIAHIAHASSLRLREAPWYRKKLLPASFSIEPWESVSREEWEEIRWRQDWYPAELTPFRNERRIEPLNSVVLRHEGKIAGWQINHRMGRETIRYTTLFIDPALQPYGLALPLQIESIRRHLESPQVESIPRAVFIIYASNSGMMRHVERHVLEYLDELNPLVRSAKKLRG